MDPTKAHSSRGGSGMGLRLGIWKYVLKNHGFRVLNVVVNRTHWAVSKMVHVCGQGACSEEGLGIWMIFYFTILQVINN